MRLISFPTFAGHWSPIIASKALRASILVPETFDNVPVVLFRDLEGKARALVDRCPHRSAKLSIGTLRTDGLIQCAFHGWAFAENGKCQKIPLNADINLSAMCAQRVAVAERGGLIWLNGTPDPDNPPPLVTPPSLDAPDWFGDLVIRDWNCHWSRAVQTSLDVAHIPFVHPRSIGAAFGRTLGKGGDAVLDHELNSNSFGGFKMTWSLKSRDQTDAVDGGWVEFLPPNGMSLNIPQKQQERESLLHIWSAPLSSGRCRMIVVSRRNFGRFALIPKMYSLLTPIILAEDRRNMDNIWPSEVPASGEVSVSSDAPTIAFQKYYRKAFLP